MIGKSSLEQAVGESLAVKGRPMIRLRRKPARERTRRIGFRLDERGDFPGIPQQGQHVSRRGCGDQRAENALRLGLAGEHVFDVHRLRSHAIGLKHEFGVSRAGTRRDRFVDGWQQHYGTDYRHHHSQATAENPYDRLFPGLAPIAGLAGSTAARFVAGRPLMESELPRCPGFRSGFRVQTHHAAIDFLHFKTRRGIATGVA